MKDYSEAIGSGESVLLIHGIACDRSYFQEIAHYLGRYYHVISYDRRGYGRHIKEKFDDFSLDAQTKDAYRVLQAYAEVPAYIVAHSMGCIIALNLAMMYPQTIKGMLLIDPIFGYDCENAKIFGEWKEDLEYFQNNNKIQKAYAYFHKKLGMGKKKTETVPGFCDMKKMKADMDNLQNFMQGELKVLLEKIPAMEEVLCMKTPVMVGTTERTSQNIFSLIAEREAAMLGWKTVDFPGFHNSMREQPDDSAAQIIEVLKTI